MLVRPHFFNGPLTGFCQIVKVSVKAKAYIFLLWSLTSGNKEVWKLLFFSAVCICRCPWPQRAPLSIDYTFMRWGVLYKATKGVRFRVWGHMTLPKILIPKKCETKKDLLWMLVVIFSLLLTEAGAWPTWALLKSGKESIEVLVTIRHKEYVQTVARTVDGGRSVVPTKSSNNTWVDAVTVSDFHVVITTSMVMLQAEHHKPVDMRIGIK